MMHVHLTGGAIPPTFGYFTLMGFTDFFKRKALPSEDVAVGIAVRDNP